MTNTGQGDHIDFFCTMTLKPTMYRKDIDKQYDETANELLVSLKMLSKKISIVTELTKAMNVHYHFIISLEGSKRKLVNFFRNDTKFGFMNASPIRSYEHTWAYMRKDLEITTKELGRRVILIDDYNIFSNKERLLYGTQF